MCKINYYLATLFFSLGAYAIFSCGSEYQIVIFFLNYLNLRLRKLNNYMDMYANLVIHNLLAFTGNVILSYIWKGDVLKKWISILLALVKSNFLLVHVSYSLFLFISSSNSLLVSTNYQFLFITGCPSLLGNIRFFFRFLQSSNQAST